MIRGIQRRVESFYGKELGYNLRDDKDNQLVKLQLIDALTIIDL